MNWYADCRIGFRFFSTSSLAGYIDFNDNQINMAGLYLYLCQGCQAFSLVVSQPKLETHLTKYRIILISAWRCGSVVPYCLRQLTAFLLCYVPVSTFILRLSRSPHELSFVVKPSILLFIMPYLGALPSQLLRQPMLQGCQF